MNLRTSLIVMAMVLGLVTTVNAASYGGGSGTEADPYQIATPANWQKLMITFADWNKSFILTADIDLAGFNLSPVGSLGAAFTGVFDGKGHIIRNAVMIQLSSNYVGLFGYLRPGGQVKNLGVINANIQGYDGIGGLVGKNEGGIVNYCYTTCRVSGSSRVGGIAGENVTGGTITSCYATADVSGTGDYVGGLVGQNGGIISTSNATGSVNGTGDYIGGLTGWNGGMITNGYATGTVSGSSRYVGGLMGWNGGMTSFCYAVGKVTGGYSYVGGLVAWNDGTIVTSFWDKNTSGRTTSAGGTGLTTSQMKDVATYLDAGWDMVGESENGSDDIWKMPKGAYPIFAWQKSPPYVNAGPDVLFNYPPDRVQLAGIVEDDSLPNGTIEIWWTFMSGPGAVVFEPNKFVVNPIAVLPKPGVYVLRLTANNGQVESFDDLTITLQNNPPVVNAGSDVVSKYPPDRVQLAGHVEDDTLPSENIGIVWSMVSGPAAVVFQPDALALNPVVVFCLPGVYVLRLTASDRQLQGFDDLTITMQNNPPVVNAGVDLSLKYPPDRVQLAGHVEDDTLPNGNMAVAWSLVSGPGTVVFEPRASVVDPVAVFSLPGVYVLRLTASDGLLQGFDDVKITYERVNTAPVVSVGPDLVLKYPEIHVQLTGHVEDDLFPGSVLGVEWKKISGPGTVVFTPSASVLDPNAALSTPGIYVLRLTARDGQLEDFDELTITFTRNYGGGSGTIEDPYRIGEVVDWQKLMNTSVDWNKYFVLTANIDLAGVSLKPVAPDTNPSQSGFQGTAFTGIFDGNGHIIHNATISQPNSNYVGLFGYLRSGGQVKNLGVINANIQGKDIVGGLVGTNEGGKVNSCYTTGMVRGSIGVGGLVGGNMNGIVTSCYTTGMVRGSIGVGGLVGDNISAITSCYATGAVSGADWVGGLTGGNGGTISDCCATGVVDGTGDNACVGGMVGDNYGMITSCYATGSVSSAGNNGYVGGLTGMGYYGTIIACYATGTVSSGGNDGYVGGLMGYDYYGTITACYATGSVTGTGVDLGVGGLVGANESGTVATSFWDTLTSGQTTSAGGTGLTTIQMQTYSTYIDAGWDFINETQNGTFDTWTMPKNAYPILSWQNQAPVVNAGVDVVLNYPPDQVQLAGHIEDDTLPNGNMGSVWSLISGPGVVVFEPNEFVVNPVAVLPLPGMYVLRLTASDGQLESFDEVTVTYERDNSAPVVEAGADMGLKYPPDWIKLAGNVEDDGLPFPATLSSVWSVVSGPGTVVFTTSELVLDPVVAFSLPGEYVLRLTASDGQLEAFDEITVTYERDNAAPVVSVGPDRRLKYPETQIQLAGLVEDDGLPLPPVLSSVWSMVSGPKVLVFEPSALVLDPVVAFSLPGEYVLRLTTSDGQLEAFDEVTITYERDNAAPVVSAGPDLMPNSSETQVLLSGHVEDDGFPMPGNLSSVWSMVSGPGAVVFEPSASVMAPVANFSLPGVYVLRLTTSDGQLEGFDELTVTLTFTYSGGSGTTEGPYKVDTAADWQRLMTTSADWNKSFILTADLDLAGVTVTPVGSLGVLFSGILDGNGHILRNVVINQPSGEYIGLFGYLDSVGRIQNLGIEDVNIKGRSYVGTLVGWNAGTITDCHSMGTVTGTYSDVGGLVGRNESGTITACNAKGMVNGNDNVGGLVGVNQSTITSSYATGAVTGTRYYVGGLVGNNGSWGIPGGTITACYATGTVKGVLGVGGMVGQNYGVITSCYATGAVSGTGDSYGGFGGMVGLNGGAITSSYATGTVSGIRRYGGLVGENSVPDAIVACYWDKDTSGQATSAGGTGLTTIQMQTYSTYIDAGWDFVGESVNGNIDLWKMPKGGYPIFAWQNAPPYVNAGPDVLLKYPPDRMQLAGFIEDDGLPNGNIESVWSMVSGPATVVFEPNEFVLDPVVVFSQPGIYVLRLMASDGQLQVFDDVTIAYVLDVIYVDNDAPIGGDGRSWVTAFVYLQDALNLAHESGGIVKKVCVASGRYQPDITITKPDGSKDRAASFLLPDSVEVMGGFAGINNSDPNDRNPHDYLTILSGDLNVDDGPDFTNYGDNSFCVVRGAPGAVLDGFTIYGGNSSEDESPKLAGGLVNEAIGMMSRDCIFTRNMGQKGGGVSNTGTLMLTHCIIDNNWATQSGGGFCNTGVSAISDIVNCPIINNMAAAHGGGIDIDQGIVHITNSILWGNTAPVDSQIYSGSIDTQVQYSDIHNGFAGTGNFNQDPLFADPNNGDYHLKSQFGRWDPRIQTWLYDDITSPCIDAGDPKSDYQSEPWPNGKRIDIGVYGGTSEASISPIGSVADLNHDWRVDLSDFSIFSTDWMKSTPKHIPQGNVKVDGDLSEWSDNVLWLPLNQIYDGNPTDIESARFALRWNGITNKIYAAIVIKDLGHIYSDAYGLWNSSDRIEVHCQSSGAGGLNYNTTFENAQKYYIAPNQYGGSWACFPGNRSSANAGLECCVTVKGDYLVYEVGVTPFEYYGGLVDKPDSIFVLESGCIVGFDITAITCTGNGIYGGMLSENMMIDKYKDAGQFAKYTLIKETPPKEIIPGESDLNRDLYIDIDDFAIFTGYWLSTQIPDGMVFVPAGTFEMGNSTNAEEGDPDELPVHTVTLDSFAMGKYEITNSQYCAFLNSAYPSQLKLVGGVVYASSDTDNSFPYCDTFTSSSYSQIAFLNNTFSVRTKGGKDMTNHPLVCVSWYGSVAYCNWRSQQEGKQICYNLSTWNCDFSKKGYRLATEAEWEYAARGGRTGSRFPWGDMITHSQANYFSNSSYSYDTSATRGYHPTWNDGIYPYTSQVGSFPANAYGLCDMAGNVWEWCHDWYGGYTSSSQTNPTGPTTVSNRVIRGGRWDSFSRGCRVSYRINYAPYFRGLNYGFRVVLNN